MPFRYKQELAIISSIRPERVAWEIFEAKVDIRAEWDLLVVDRREEGRGPSLIKRGEWVNWIFFWLSRRVGHSSVQSPFTLFVFY